MVRSVKSVDVVVAISLCILGCGRQQSLAERRSEVAAKGAEVMPFDLGKTTHVFQDLPDGGLQTVTANSPDDTVQVRLIQEHLQLEALRFAKGDFGDPRTIHGHSMPGLAELSQGAARIRVEYAGRRDGGVVRYTTNDPALVAALHHWFAAQRMDHGS